MHKRAFVSILIFFILSNLTFSNDQPASISRTISTYWSDNEGLPSNSILDVVQDDTGYIWLASYDGLIRFDGNQFVPFNEKEHGFSATAVRVLCKGKDGSLWVGTNAAGLYHFSNGKFFHYGIEEGLPDLSVREVVLDNNNILWVGTANGIAKLDTNKKNQKLTAIDNVRGIVSFILPFNNKDILFGTNLPGLKVIHDNHIKDFHFDKRFHEKTFSAGYLDDDHSIWLGTSFGEIVVLKNDTTVEYFSLQEMRGASINDFVQKAKNILYVATDKGILSIHKDQKKIEVFLEELSLPDQKVSSLWQDQESNLWAGMEQGGLVKFSTGKFFNILGADKLPSSSVNAVVEDQENNIWIATDAGVVCVKSNLLSKKRSQQIDLLLQELSGIRVRQIRKEKDGTLFFATYSNKGLVRFYKNGAIKTLSKANGLGNNRVRFSYRSHRNILWVGTTVGPAIYFENISKAIPLDLGLSNSFILCALEDSKGNMWIGTDGGGITLLDMSHVSFTQPHAKMIKAKSTFTKKDGLAGNIVFRITEDSKARLWLSTGEGLSLYKDGKFHAVNSVLGLGKKSIFNVIEDDNANLWIVSSKELLQVKADSLVQAVQMQAPAKEVKRYNRLDGLSGQLSANAWASFGKDNRLYLPTIKGVSVYSPHQDVINRLPPPVVIEKVLLDKIAIDVLTKNNVIPSQTKRISFIYTALSYTIPQRVQFEYKLEGFDLEWSSSGNRREVSYTNLPHGQYTFRVRASNSDGVTNESGASFSFYKKPFFYETVWFYLVLTTILIAIGFLLIQARFQHLKKQAEALDKRVKEKTAELAKEKEKSDNLLRNILPISVMQELMKTGTVKPRLYPSTTVLFADLVNFTEWSSQREPEEVIVELNKIFTAFDNIMDACGCERIKTLGDGYLACAGFNGEKNHAERIIKAAIKMLKYFESLQKNNPQSFDFKIGIDTGSLTGGIVGEKKYIFDVFGDVVNTAFRLESNSAPMSCTVSEKTVKIVQEKYSFWKRPIYEIKGKGKMQTFYLMYRQTSPTMKNYKTVERRFAKLESKFQDNKFDECTKLISQFDKTLLEPEMAYRIQEMQVACKNNVM